MGAEEQVEEGESVAPDAPELESKVAAAVAVWTGQLIDLGGRNTLLYYKDLKQGTLALDDADEVATERLLSSHTVRLSVLFAEDKLAPAARRARTVRAKAQENFEERGLQTLFLAWGMATWTNTRGTATPAAPVLLRQAHLVPRGGAGEDFELSLPGEWELNPTLLHLVEVDHGVHVDASQLIDMLDEHADPPDASVLFDRLTKEAAQVPGFAVTPRVVLGNFSYAKLPMVKDLETATELLASSPLVAAIAGDENARQVLRDRHPTDVREDAPDHTPPADEFLVLDADASQSYVINSVVSGGDLVCVGPPGTGKSQTIANLIATLSARGRRVLFVAEKRAAIDAVLKRLAQVGLSDLVMDLHDGPGSRKALAQQLQRALAAASHIPLPDMEAEQQALVRRRDVLCGRSEALHAERAPWGVSVYEVQAELLGIDATVRSAQRLPLPQLQALDAQAFRDATADLEGYGGLGGLEVWSSSSPWLAALRAGTITSADQARAALEATNTLATHTLPATISMLQGMLQEVGLLEPATLSQWTEALELLAGVGDTLRLFRLELFDQDLGAIVAALAPLSRSGLARLGHTVSDGAYRQARKLVRSMAVGDLPPPAQVHHALELAAAQAARWRQVSGTGSSPRLPGDLVGATASYGQLAAELRSLEAYARVDLENVSVDELAERLVALRTDQGTLFRLPEIHRLHQALQRRGFEELLEEMTSRGLNTDQALACLRHVWLSSILEAVSISDVRIGTFDSPAQSRTVAEFRSGDVHHISSAPVRIRRALAEHITVARDAYRSESEVVAAEANKKTRHIPIRQLFQTSPHVLGAVKPCWAMSPLVVSQLLPAERCFDVVVFDEASQVTPADAVGALMRASQAIVAGDPHQLPPTSFFLSGASDDDGDDGTSAAADGALTRDMESVLDMLSALLPAPYGTRMLSWHYRSRDERLIAFSNAQPSLYDFSLVTFPGTSTGSVPEHHLVPFTPNRPAEEDSSADEVRTVVELVTSHAHEHPSESLGVITMGIKHAERISESLRRARQADPLLDEFMSESAAEPFFVKNLERVQGDERDAIVLSIGYGKLADGRMQYRFGPVNNEGGQRRLNVAITRARSRMTVVSSFSSTDMDPNRLTSEGVRMLQRYLAYAESGGTDLGAVVRDRPPLNPFEIDVRDKLTAAGIPLVAQYGVSGFWIDFAAEHPTDRGRMVLAIEADGASYHSSHTARDRDRLRQQHLENLGWHFHRIWSTEWFHHHEDEVGRALEAYRRAVERVDSPAPVLIGTSDGPGAAVATARFLPAALREPATSAAPERSAPPPLLGRRGNISAYSTAELVRLIRWIESDTLLRTEDQVIAEVMQYLGFQRRGANIVNTIADAIVLSRVPRR